ncbi:hypothetical protein J3D54_000538 [Pseudomonas sp. GGS8]|uniref:hypothetical protein n=1 Tax=Pseudomonas sp. GGS8 TaxID=2817892 RepID=UPI00345F5256|nr:hypothetical protein [Pseudomonas sp. GGS8]
MNILSTEKIPSRLAWAIVAFGWSVEPAMSTSMDIKAVFRPDPSKPADNKFINQTPSSGYCASYPSECKNLNMFSIRLPLKFESVRPMLPDAESRNNAMFRVPAQWRSLPVKNENTGELEQVEIRITGMGSQYKLSETTVSLTGASNWLEGHQTLWGSSWVYSPPPCEYSGVGSYDPWSYTFFWKTPVEGVCVKSTRYPIPAMTYNYVDFAYELRTPNPLEMSSGLYTGTMSYRVGPGGDFDMGDVMLPDDNLITLNFALNVEHTLKVDIPPGGNQVELVPPGGWQAWLTQGRKPTRLFRDQTFNISSSSRFKMQLECEIPGLFDCMIRDPVSQRAAVVQLSVSLPNGLTDISGQPVTRRPLRVGQVNAQEFKPGYYVDRAPGILHFEIAPYYVNYMIKPGEASRYSGNITVIWDSDVG